MRAADEVLVVSCMFVITKDFVGAEFVRIKHDE